MSTEKKLGNVEEKHQFSWFFNAMGKFKDKGNQGIVLDDLEKLKSYVITR